MTTALSAGAVGLALGFLMSRHTVCFNAGVRRGAFSGDWSILRIFAVAIALQLLLLPLGVALGVDPLVESSEAGGLGFFPLSQLAGGLVFGVGMALAGGCIAGILWKAGAGSVATAIALLGFALGEIFTRGALSGVIESFDDVSQVSEAGLPAQVGIDYAPVAVALGLLALFLLLRKSRSGLIVGLALGLVATSAWLAADLSGYGYGLGFVGGAESTREAIASGSGLPFQLFLAVGVVGGAAIAIRGPMRFPDGPRAVRALGGGLLMGFGGTLAHACNIGHGLAGLPLLSLGSALAIASMAAGGAMTWRYLLAPRPRVRGSEHPEPSW